MSPLPLLHALPLAATVEPWLPEGSGWIGSWSPGIGDPDFMGWFTVFAYLLAALASWRARKLVKTVDVVDGDKERRFWTGMGLLLFFLCVNKQLDLQTAFTEALRLAAHRQGWYQSRRIFQVAFIVAMAVAVPLVALLLFRFARGFARSIKLAGAGIVILAVFILVRASSFHHVDLVLGDSLSSFKVNWILELGGIAVVLWGARRRIKELRRIRRAQTPSR
jgi:hypothetical protein